LFIDEEKRLKVLSQRPVEDGFFRLAATIEPFWAGLGAVHL
jgi:hypothetical protein